MRTRSAPLPALAALAGALRATVAAPHGIGRILAIADSRALVRCFFLSSGASSGWLARLGSGNGASLEELIATAGVVGAIAGIFTTWWQFRNAKVEETRNRLQEMILSDDFIKVLAAISSIVNLSQGPPLRPVNRRARILRSMIDQKINEQFKLLGEAVVQPKCLAVGLLLPTNIAQPLSEVVRLSLEGKNAAAVKEMRVLTKELKEVFGFTIFE